MEVLIISKEDAHYSARERIYGRKIKYVKNTYPSSFSPSGSGWAEAIVYFEDEPKQEYYFIDVLFDDKDFINKFVLGKNEMTTHLTRQINIPVWKYHLGHVAIGALIYCFLYSIGLAKIAVYAVIIYPWIKKIYQWYMQGLPDWKDAIGDWAQHQVIFVFVLLKNGNYHIGFAVLIGIIAIYFGTLQYQRP